MTRGHDNLELVRRRNFLLVLDIRNNIKKENSSSSKQCEMLFQFWFLEIGFHIHPEDATEADKIMMLDICEEYGEDWADEQAVAIKLTQLNSLKE